MWLGWVGVRLHMSHDMRKPVYANNKGTEQPAHLRSLISSFVVCCLDSIISVVSISEISSLNLASVAVQAGLRLTWSQTPKMGFLVTRLISNALLTALTVLALILESYLEPRDQSNPLIAHVQLLNMVQVN